VSPWALPCVRPHRYGRVRPCAGLHRPLAVGDAARARRAIPYPL